MVADGISRLEFQRHARALVSAYAAASAAADPTDDLIALQQLLDETCAPVEGTSRAYVRDLVYALVEFGWATLALFEDPPPRFRQMIADGTYDRAQAGDDRCDAQFWLRHLALAQEREA